MKYPSILLLYSIFFAGANIVFAQVEKTSRFRAVAIAELGENHGPYVRAGKVWLNKLASDSNFTVDYISDSKPINKEFLSHYQLFIQLDFPPYTWSKESEEAFKEYIEEGKGGWIGFHHPTLLGEFDGYPLWQWYSKFMGDIRFKAHIAGGTQGKVNVEDGSHPVMKDIPRSFTLKDEWYIYNQNPRPNVRVLATVDESSYDPPKNVKMGDHPVIWTNEKVKAKNVYVFMGHGPELFQDKVYTTLFRNCIFWAADSSKRN
ncbi:MAG: ThuA domain-containing protein [Bacteroidota bacterium]